MHGLESSVCSVTNPLYETPFPKVSQGMTSSTVTLLYLDALLAPDNILGGVLALHHLCPVHRHHERGEARVVSDVQSGPSIQKAGHSVSLMIKYHAVKHDELHILGSHGMTHCIFSAP